MNQENGHSEQDVRGTGAVRMRSLSGWRRAMVWVVALLFVVSGSLTAVLLYQARGLEQRVLEAIQPHLAKDVRIGAVRLSVSQTWPDVEVVLQDVWIEDALEEGTPFLELQELGVVFGWRALLSGRFHAVEVRASGGEVSLVRRRNGDVNWKFWRSVEGPADDVEWGIDEVTLVDVRTVGDWWAPGAEDVLEWGGHCRHAGLSVAREGVDGGSWQCNGSVDVKSLRLEAGGQEWISGWDLGAGMDMEWSGDEVHVEILDGVVRRDGRVSNCHAWLSDADGFSMSLGFPDVEADAVALLIPPHLMTDTWMKETVLSGGVSVEVVVGRGAQSGGWNGPVSDVWSGSWAVRLRMDGLGIRNGDVLVEDVNGGATAYSSRKGWEVGWEGLHGRVAGGEWRCDGSWTDARGHSNVHLKGEALVRPAEAVALMGMAAALPTGVVLGDGGTWSLKADVNLERPKSGDWKWSSGSCEGTFDVGLIQSMGSGGPENPWKLGQGQFEAGPKTWSVGVGDFKGPGFDGRMSIAEGGQGGLSLEVALNRLEVPLFQRAISGFGSGDGDPGDLPGRVLWNISVEDVAWDALTADRLSARGEYQPRIQEGRIENVESEVFEGALMASGRWDRRGIRFDGRMVDVDVAALLSGTGGLGQATLLPSHVKGRAWAEGGLTYHFGAEDDLTWETDLVVRLEQGELIDFELLQRIPETLEAEGKYRLLADANDLRRRLRRVRFNTIEAEVSLEQGVFTLAPTDVVSDAMDVGISGWQRLSGGMDYTLDFALRDLKSNKEEFGITEDDGLGHRFFLAIGGTLEAPEFGYDRAAHQSHRRVERRNAVDRLRNLVRGGEQEGLRADSLSQGLGVDLIRQREGADSVLKPKRQPPGFIDDGDDFSP